MNNWKKILNELSYRVSSGIPDLTNEQHLLKLWDILKEEKWPIDARVELLKNLQELDFSNKQDLTTYASKHKIRPTTKVNVGGKETTAGEELPDLKDKDTETDVKNELTDFENYLSKEQKEAIKLDEKEKIEKLKMLDDMSNLFKSLPDDIKNTSESVFAKGLVYEGRPNSGIGKNRLGYLDVKNLSENKEYLLESYGDGSPEKIKKFVNNSRKIKVSEEFINDSFDLLPKNFQSALNGKGKVGDAGKNNHFLGYIKEDGTITSDRNDPSIKKDKQDNLVVKRGNPGNKDRGKFVWRCILEQGGQDPYTGLPLDLSNIDLEHVVAFDNKDNGKPTKDDYLNREHDNNIIVCATNVNQKKSNLSMKDFIERNVDTQTNKTEDDFKKISTSYEDINKVSSQSKQMAALLLDEGNLKEYDYNTLMEAFSIDDESFLSAKKQFSNVVKDENDQKKIKSLGSELGKDIIMSMGLNRGLTDKTGRRTIKLSSDNLYRGFVLSLAENPDRTQEFKDEWDNARKVGNSDEYRLKGKGQQGMIKYLVEKNIISKKVLNDPKLGKVFNNALKD